MVIIITMDATGNDAVVGVPQVKVLDYGRYKFNQQKVVRGKPPAEPWDLHVETTNRIPRRVGEGLGMRIEIADPPEGDFYELRVVWHHPPIRLPDGKTQTDTVKTAKLSAEQCELVPIVIYPNARELGAGDFKLSVYLDNVLVAKQEFTMINVDDLREADCAVQRDLQGE